MNKTDILYQISYQNVLAALSDYPPVFDVLIVNGSPSGSSPELACKLAKLSGYSIAADSGASLLLAGGLTPNEALGDMDSIDPSDLAKLKNKGLVHYEVDPVDKDLTDLELALQIASSKAQIGICVTGFSGGRIDHELAAIGAMCSCKSVRLALDSKCLIAFLSAGEALSLSCLGIMPKQEYSVISCFEPALVSQDGVRYPQARAELPQMSGLGMSNVVEHKDAYIQCHKGRICVVACW